MKTSSFLTSLRANASLPLVFRAGRETVLPGYHLTEVKRVTYETLDCGAKTHRWTETQFEVWAPGLEKIIPGRGHMPVEKFLKIIGQVESELPFHGESEARIFASLNGQPASLYEIDAVRAQDGKLWVELNADRARCKAAERKLASATGGCCGSSSKKEAGAVCCA